MKIVLRNISILLALILLMNVAVFSANANETQVSERQIPLYFQTDYPEIRYGAGSIATSGCSVTCLAMVATALTGHEYMPDQLAEYFSAYNSINHAIAFQEGTTPSVRYTVLDDWKDNP